MEELRICCFLGETERAQELLQTHQLNINQSNEGGSTALIIACEFGRIEIVELLLEEKGIDLNAENKFGETAFFMACAFGETEIVKILLKRDDVNLNKEDKLGRTPIDAAIYNGFYKTAQWVLTSPKLINLRKHRNAIQSKNDSGNIELKETLDLLTSYQVSPNRTRNQIRRKFKIIDSDSDSGDIFALIVLLVDNYLKLL